MDSNNKKEESDELQTVWMKGDMTADRETAFLSGNEEFSESSSSGKDDNIIKPIENVKLEDRKGSNKTPSEVLEIVDRGSQVEEIDTAIIQLNFPKGFDFHAYTPSKDSLSSSTSEEVIRSPKIFHDSLEDSEELNSPNKEPSSPLIPNFESEFAVAPDKLNEEQKENKENEESELNVIKREDDNKEVRGKLENFTNLRDGLPASSKEEVRERKALGEFPKQKPYKDVHGRAICAKCCVW